MRGAATSRSAENLLAVIIGSITELASTLGGKAHVNTAESFFALLKRGIVGSFHHVSPEHLHRYCDEFSFRWDYRSISDSDRTEIAIRQTEGKRLSYRRPTFKD